MSEPNQPLFPLPQDTTPTSQPQPDILTPSQPVSKDWVSRRLTTKSLLLGCVVGLVVAGAVWFAFSAGGKRQPAETFAPGSNRQTAAQATPEVGSDTPQPDGDLGLKVPMSRPQCDGMGIVVLMSLVTPGRYADEARRALSQYPGSSYLRTDRACPSLRQATEQGNPIYAVYRTAGYRRDQVCDAVRAAGGGAYGKWLDTTTPPSYIIPC